ncbi:hypothetical protein [Algoriphagus sp. A40]|uniref:hypothetical protein n=1 Tax=Algoriphagus sp. A40 TaxID=1945863 RepID=UPI000984EE8B|nr:hypothetical protein [Algoriphagus sp. A40]OOG77661.1 hypothetical protein B0E43_04505 [Algoriphagus sp. A40]
MKYFLILFFFVSQVAIAQTPLTYINSNGDKHLAGPFELDDLRKDTTYSGWFESNYARFQLKGEDTSWKSSFEQTEVEIYIGTWCGDSKRWVPQFVKLWNELGLDENQLKFTALYDGEEKYKQGPNAEEKGKQIHRVPTFIFKSEGKEYARMVEYPRNDLEKDLAQIAVGFASEPNYRAATYLLDLFEKEPMDSVWKNVNYHLGEVYSLVGKEVELNTLGYVFQYSDRMPQALLTFQFNTLIYPYSPRVFSSFGDALRISGDKEAAITAYQRVLALEPKHENASAQLKILKPD